MSAILNDQNSQSCLDPQSTTWSSHVISITWSRWENQGISPAITCWVNTSHFSTENNHSELNGFKRSSDRIKDVLISSAVTDLKAVLNGSIQDQTAEHKRVPLRSGNERAVKEVATRVTALCVSFAYGCLLTCAHEACVTRGIEFHCCSDMLKESRLSVTAFSLHSLCPGQHEESHLFCSCSQSQIRRKGNARPIDVISNMFGLIDCLHF